MQGNGPWTLLARQLVLAKIAAVSRAVMNDWPPTSNKSKDMQTMSSALMGHEDNVFERSDCATCDATDLQPEDFTDEISRREFGISRLCQKCQDEVFS